MAVPSIDLLVPPDPPVPLETPAPVRFFVDQPLDWGTAVADKNPATARSIRRYSGGGRIWCHLVTDGTRDDLYAFGVKLFGDATKAAKWIQVEGQSLPHYDVTPAMRTRAIALGATPITHRELVELVRADRARRLAAAAATPDTEADEF